MVDETPRADRERMRSEYQAESLARCHRSVRFTAGFGTLLLLLFIPFDLTLPPALFPLALAVRLTCATTMALIFGLLHLPIGARFPRLFGFLTVLTPAMMIICMLMLLGWESGYFAGLHMLMLTAALIISWSPIWSGVLGVLITAIYAAVTITMGDIPPPRLLENLLSLLASVALAVLTCTVRGRLHLTEFERHWSVAQAYRHKSEFFANVSHELRTPLHVMFGYLDMLLDGEEKWNEEEGRTMLQRIRTQGLNLHKLVSDLLDSAKVEAGKMEVQWQSVSLPELSDHVVESFRPLVEEKGIQLSLQYADQLPAIVSDERKTKQILTNLLANALKFTEAGFIRVDIRRLDELGSDDLDSFVLLNGEKSRPLRRRDLPLDGVAILVSDTGIGIHRSELKHLAEDYSQAGSADTAKYGGTGLGLSLSRKLVALLGGHVAVRSSHGLGSTFAVVLPCRAAAAGSAAAQNGSGRNGDRPTPGRRQRHGSESPGHIQSGAEHPAQPADH